jgi:hypothetical protein
MLIDKQNTLSWADAVTTDQISENVIDLISGAIKGLTANTVRDIGAGQPLYLHMRVNTAFDTAEEDGTLDITLESDANVGLDSGSATTHLTIAQLAEATLVAGYKIADGIPLPAGAYKRYLGLRYNVGSHAFTAGKIDAWISDNREDTRVYESSWSTGVN